MMRGVALILFCSLAFAGEVLPPLQEPLGGTLILHGTGPVSDVVRGFFLNVASREAKQVVVITTAAENEPAATEAFWQERFESKKPKRITVLRAPLAADAGEALKTATGVWIEGERAEALQTLAASGVAREIKGVLERGGVVLGAGEGAALLGARSLRGPGAEIVPGLGVLSNCVVDTQVVPAAGAPRAERALAALSGFAGVTIGAETALVIQQRWTVVSGSGAVSIHFAAVRDFKGRAARTLTLRTPARADLLTISRTALDRAGTPFPPAVAPRPDVPAKGLLVIGGSGIPPAAVERFMEHCGGSEARIVVIPTALDDEPTLKPREVEFLRDMGAKTVTVVHAKTRAEANSEAVLDPIRKATGIWFCGGRQWRLVDKYLDTRAEAEMHALLQRGGAIAGGSAGATIQGDYLVRGNPLGNVEMMVEGYERGLGFLKGVAIDQHFTQRNRFADMTSFKKAFPHYLGIGIDENTALLVRGSVAEIVGEHGVAFYDKGLPLPAGVKDYTSLRDGEKYDLGLRRKVE